MLQSYLLFNNKCDERSLTISINRWIFHLIYSFLDARHTHAFCVSCFCLEEFLVLFVRYVFLENKQTSEQIICLTTIELPENDEQEMRVSSLNRQDPTEKNKRQLGREMKTRAVRERKSQ